MNVYLCVWIIDLCDMCYDFWKCLAPDGESFLPSGLQRNFVWRCLGNARQWRADNILFCSVWHQWSWGFGQGHAGLVTSGKVRNGDLRCVIDVGGEVRICCTFVWGYERGGSYVPCSHLRLLWAGRFIVGFTHVGLRAGRFVELDYGRGGP